MTGAELLADLRERLDRGVSNLESLLDAGTLSGDRKRINGKIEGLKLVRDWLRSYDGASS